MVFLIREYQDTSVWSFSRPSEVIRDSSSVVFSRARRVYAKLPFHAVLTDVFEPRLMMSHVFIVRKIIVSLILPGIG